MAEPQQTSARRTRNRALRLAVLLAAGLLLVAAAMAYRHFWLSLPAGLPPWPGGVAIHRAYNEVIHRLAAERECVRLVPMYEAFLGHGIHCRQFWSEHYRPDDPHYWFASNLEDPNIRGYDAIRRLFLNEMVKLSEQLKQEEEIALSP